MELVASYWSRRHDTTRHESTLLLWLRHGVLGAASSGEVGNLNQFILAFDCYGIRCGECISIFRSLSVFAWILSTFVFAAVIPSRRRISLHCTCGLEVRRRNKQHNMFKKAGKTSKKGWKKSKKAGKDLKKKLLKDKRKREKKCKKNKERKSKKDAEGKKAKAKCAEESEENKDLVTESDMKALERAKPEAVDKILSSKKELNDDDEPEPIDVDEFSLDDVRF